MAILEHSRARLAVLAHRAEEAGQGLFAGVGYSAVAQAAPLVVNVALTPVLIRRLGLDLFGVWSLVLIFLWTLTSLDGGVSASLARFYSFHGARSDRAGTGRLALGSLLLFLCFGALVSGLGVVLAPAVGYLHIPPRLHGDAVQVIRLLGPLVTLALLSDSATSLLQALGRFRGLAGVTLCSCGGYAAALLLVVGHRTPLLALAGVTALRFVILVVGGFALAWRDLAVRRPLLPSRAECRAFGAYAWRMQLSGFTVFLNGEIDAFVVAALLPVRFVGIYAAGYQAAAALRSLPLYAFPPLLTRLTTRFSRDGLPATVQEFHRLQSRWWPSALGYGVVTTVAVAFAVPVWLGPQLALSGAVAAVLLAGYTVHVALTGLRTCLVRAIGRPGLETRYSWAATAVNTVLTVPLTMLLGITGVVAATAIGLVAGSLYFCVLCRPLIGRHPWRMPPRWLPAVGLGITVTVAGELPILRTGWHGTLALLLAGLPVLAALSLAALVALRRPAERQRVRVLASGSGRPR